MRGGGGEGGGSDAFPHDCEMTWNSHERLSPVPPVLLVLDLLRILSKSPKNSMIQQILHSLQVS